MRQTVDCLTDLSYRRCRYEWPRQSVWAILPEDNKTCLEFFFLKPRSKWCPAAVAAHHLRRLAANRLRLTANHLRPAVNRFPRLGVAGAAVMAVFTD
jgi:hypothetical protein